MTENPAQTKWFGGRGRGRDWVLGTLVAKMSSVYTVAGLARFREHTISIDSVPLHLWALLLAACPSLWGPCRVATLLQHTSFPAQSWWERACPRSSHSKPRTHSALTSWITCAPTNQSLWPRRFWVLTGADPSFWSWIQGCHHPHHLSFSDGARR